MIIAYFVTTVETVGDLTATYEASDLDTKSPEYAETIQGGLLSDGFCSLLSGLFTSMVRFIIPNMPEPCSSI